MVMEMAWSILHAKDLPKRLWAEAINTVVYILNRTINHQLGNVTPYEKYFKEKPSVQHLQVFGSLAWVFVNKHVRSKLDPKSIQAYFVGYSSTSRAYRFLDLVTDKILESADYTIDEKSRKYCPGFPPNPGFENYVNISIDPLPPATTPTTRPLQLADEINDCFNEAMGVLSSSGSLLQSFLQPTFLSILRIHRLLSRLMNLMTLSSDLFKTC